MSKRILLMIVMVWMTLFMTYVAVATSLQSNLFTEWSTLSQIPWMTATLKDFYQLIVLIWLWVIYKENSWLKAGIWGILFVCGGSITTSAYVFWQLWKLKPGEPVESILTRKAS
jgi:hypothetical protein